MAEGKNRRLPAGTGWVLGIIGCVCFGVGDWLLGYVDPAAVNEAFSVIRAGHGADYDLTKIAVTLALGAIGVPFLLLGCARSAELVTDERGKALLRVTMLLLPTGWLLIHFTVSASIYAYSWCMRAGETALAERLALDMIGVFDGTRIIAALFAAVPLILLPVYTLLGKTALPKSSVIFTPLLWMALLSAVKFIVPPTPFTNGIDTFAMNAGMIVWFLYLLVKGG